MISKKKKKGLRQNSGRFFSQFRKFKRLRGGSFRMGGAIFHFSQKIGLKSTKNMRFCILYKPMGGLEPPPPPPPPGYATGYWYLAGIGVARIFDWKTLKNSAVFTEIESEFWAEIGNSNDFSAQIQVISKKKKRKRSSPKVRVIFQPKSEIRTIFPPKFR